MRALHILCICTTVTILLLSSAPIEAHPWYQYLPDGSTAALNVADSIVCIRFAEGVPPPAAATFALERPELADNYPIWDLGDFYKIYGVSDGYDIDTVIRAIVINTVRLT